MPIEVTVKEFNKIFNNKKVIDQAIEKQGESKVKNKLTDLNNHLFAELERLGDEDLSAEDLSAEIDRAKAIANVSEKIIDNAALVLKTAEFLNEAGYGLNGNIEGNLMGFVGNEQKDLGYKND